jgi:hypothetical protein
MPEQKASASGDREKPLMLTESTHSELPAPSFRHSWRTIAGMMKLSVGTVYAAALSQHAKALCARQLPILLHVTAPQWDKMTNDLVFCARNGNRLGRRVVLRDVKRHQKCSPLGGDRWRS